MPIPAPKLRVLPNPWTCIDLMGCPAGTLPFDVFEHTKAPGWVGASVASVELSRPAQSSRVGGQDFELRPADHYRRWVYELDPKNPVVIPNTGYYRQHIASGDLIPADAETAKLCGIQDFKSAESLLEQARKDAITRFDAETEEKAWEKFGSNEPLTVSGPAAASAPAPKRDAVPPPSTKKGDA